MLEEVLGRARRRLLARQWISDLGLATAVFLGGFVLLLVAGTGVITWWAPVVLAVICFAGLAGWAVWKAPSPLDLARLLDDRCGLADELGTAIHFRDSPLEIAALQRRRAETAAGVIHVAEVFPLTVPKSTFAIAGLVVVAGVLLFIRFGTEQRIALSVPLVQLPMDPFRAAVAADQKAAERKRDLEKAGREDLLSRLGTSTPDNPAEEQLPKTPGTNLAASGADAKAGAEGQPGEGKPLDGKMDAASGKPSEAANGENDGNANPPKQGAEQSPSSRDGAPQGAQAGGKSKGPSEASSLMSKLKDAMSSLMSKMQPQSTQAQAKQQEGKATGSGQQGAQNHGQQKADSDSQSQSGGEEAASGDDQDAAGKGSANSKEQNASAKPGSGMGHQDGSKDLQDAQQLDAMGKLSEIIGKRSASVTGDMEIESQSGPQHLQTEYTQSRARHAQTSGNVNRDEVPVEMQSYVQEYFAQVRKQAAASAARAAKSGVKSAP